MWDIIYSEWVPVGVFVKTLMAFVSLLILCVLFIVIAVGVAIQNPFLVAALSSLLVFVLLVFWNYRGLEIRVTNKELLVNYGFFNHKHIPIANIVSCEQTKAPLWKYGGIGVRFCFTDRSWAYVTSFGDTVRIVPRKGRCFVFSSNSPEKLCNIIDQIKGRT